MRRRLAAAVGAAVIAVSGTAIAIVLSRTATDDNGADVPASVTEIGTILTFTTPTGEVVVSLGEPSGCAAADVYGTIISPKPC